MRRAFAVAIAALLGAACARAQVVVPATAELVKLADTSALKPPAGVPIALVEFEDLECPHCGVAAPLVRAAVAKHHLVYLHHDFPIHIGQWWSLQAAITARMLQDTVSPEAAEQFRMDVFANQSRIAGAEDLNRFTQAWFAQHKVVGSPFSMDPRYQSEVMADEALARKMGLPGTPGIFVVTQKGWVEVANLANLDEAIAKAQEMAAAK